MATDEYWLSAFYSHQGQEKPDQPDDSWDPGDIWLDYPGYGGGVGPGDGWAYPGGDWGDLVTSPTPVFSNTGDGMDYIQIDLSGLHWMNDAASGKTMWESRSRTGYYESAFPFPIWHPEPFTVHDGPPTQVSAQSSTWNPTLDTVGNPNFTSTRFEAISLYPGYGKWWYGINSEANRSAGVLGYDPNANMIFQGGGSNDLVGAYTDGSAPIYPAGAGLMFPPGYQYIVRAYASVSTTGPRSAAAVVRKDGSQVGAPAGLPFDGTSNFSCDGFGYLLQVTIDLAVDPNGEFGAPVAGPAVALAQVVVGRKSL